MNHRHLSLALAATLALTAACKPSAEVKEDASVTEDVIADENPPDDAPNMLLTGDAAGDHSFEDSYEMEFGGEYYTVDIAPGVGGASLDGETLCEISIDSKDYRTVTGLGIGSKIGEFGTPDVDLFIEEATGMVYSEREEMALQPSKLAMDGEREMIDLDAEVLGIRLGGCGE